MFDSCYEAERAKVGRYTVRVVQDVHAESPRTAYDEVGTFWTAHRDYNSPDRYTGDFWDALAEEFDVRTPTRHSYTGRFLPREYWEMETDRDLILKAVDRAAVWLWVWMYDHSGVSYAAGEANPFGCQWDSGRVGIIFAKRDKCRAEWGRNYKAKAAAYLKGEVQTFSDWASGNVWGWVIEDRHGDELESCWGYIGDADEALAEGVSEAEAMEADAAKLDAEKRRLKAERKAEKMAASIAAARPDLAPVWEGVQA